MQRFNPRRSQLIQHAQNGDIYATFSLVLHILQEINTKKIVYSSWDSIRQEPSTFHHEHCSWRISIVTISTHWNDDLPHNVGGLVLCRIKMWHLLGKACCRNPAMLVGSPLGVQAPPSFHPMQHVLSSIESCPPCPERNFQSSCLAICHPLKISVLNREENPHEFNMGNKSLISVGFNPCESGSLPKLLRCSEWTCPTNA